MKIMFFLDTILSALWSLSKFLQRVKVVWEEQAIQNKVASLQQDLFWFQERIFLTNDKLKDDLENLDKTIANAVTFAKDDLPGIEVKDMTSSELRIQLKVGVASCDASTQSKTASNA